jgi:uncharacterized protein (TIGR02118 family)
MIKSLSLLTRKPGMTHEEFVERWVNEHAPLAHAVPELRRYVLTLIHAQPERADIPTHDIEVDGIAELWYDDMEAMRRALASTEMQALRDHGALIIGRIKSYVTEEKQVIPAPPDRA